MKSSSTLLEGGGPPSGLCSQRCERDSDCAVHDDALCAKFGQARYCVEQCEPGVPKGQSFDDDKCHGRPEFACKVRVTGSCSNDVDCDASELCHNGKCTELSAECVPRCNGDSDCDGRRCHPGTGVCVDQLGGGAESGAKCMEDPVTLEHNCAANCVQFNSKAGFVKLCARGCTIAAPGACGWVDEGEPAENRCIDTIDAFTAGAGDMGFCNQLCDCNEQCSHADFICEPWTGTGDLDYYQRRGFCWPRDNGDGIGTCADE